MKKYLVTVNFSLFTLHFSLLFRIFATNIRNLWNNWN